MSLKKLHQWKSQKSKLLVKAIGHPIPAQKVKAGSQKVLKGQKLEVNVLFSRLEAIRLELKLLYTALQLCSKVFLQVH